MTRRQLVQWLFEGRATPPAARVRPDPVVGQADDPQRRFLVQLKPEEVRYLRSDFARRWLDSGPGWFLESALPTWVPPETKAEIGRLDRAGALRRTLAPVVKTFPGPPPSAQPGAGRGGATCARPEAGRDAWRTSRASRRDAGDLTPGTTNLEGCEGEQERLGIRRPGRRVVCQPALGVPGPLQA